MGGTHRSMQRPFYASPIPSMLSVHDPASQHSSRHRRHLGHLSALSALSRRTILGWSFPEVVSCWDASSGNRPKPQKVRSDGRREARITLRRNDRSNSSVANLLTEHFVFCHFFKFWQTTFPLFMQNFNLASVSSMFGIARKLLRSLSRFYSHTCRRHDYICRLEL